MSVTISSGKSPYNVTAGQVDSGVVVGGGTMFVQSGGTAISTTTSSGCVLEGQNA